MTLGFARKGCSTLARCAQNNAIRSICHVLVSATALCTLAGCMSNGYTQFYQDKMGAKVASLPPYPGSTKIYSASSNVKSDADNLYRDGYVLLGVSAFSGPAQAPNALMTHAKRVGADVVLSSLRYLGSEQTTLALPQYNPGQTYTTTSSGVVTGFGGTGSYYGNSTTTTPGTFSTQYVPVTIQRFSYEAGFFRKSGPYTLGVRYAALPTELRQQLERNTGVVISVVVNGSPAFNANILEGDVVLKMNNEDISSATDFRDKLAAAAGQRADFQIWRNGQFKNISVQLNAQPK